MVFFRRRPMPTRRRRQPLIPRLLALESRVLLATFVVNLNSDESDLDPSDGLCDVSQVLAGDQCTLRAAIEQANASQGVLDEIQFNIGAGGLQTITPGMQLPPILDGVMIDATTQPGFGAAGAPIIQLSGQAAGNANGLTLATFGASLRGLAIHLFAGAGILIQGGGGHKIAGNSIGTDGAGQNVLPNGGGILVLDSVDNEVGGAGPGDGNLVSGNFGDGIAIRGANSTRNTVTGNLIGTNQNAGAMGNGGHGVLVQGSQNLIGVNTQGQGAPNIIVFNTGDGVFVDGGIENRISLNVIRENGGLGIDLAPDGPNFPQAPDPGIGANLLQNFPELSSATRTAMTTNVRGTLNSTPATLFRIEFFFGSAKDGDPTGFGEGAQFLGSIDILTDAMGSAAIDQTFPIGVAVGDVVSATATDPAGNTSEFSQFVVAASLNLAVDSFSFAGAGALGTLEIAYTVIGAVSSPFEFAFFTSADSRADMADVERAPRVPINDPALLGPGPHLIQFDGTPYAGFLTDLDVPFFVTQAIIPPVGGIPVVESDPTDNDINFIGFFHQPGGPLMIRGRDNTDRYADDPNDVMAMRDAGGARFTTSFSNVDLVVPSGGITEIRVLGLGGDDTIAAGATLGLPLNVRGGDGDDLITGGSGNDRLDGDAGADRIGGGFGDDTMSGGADIDTVDFSVAANGVSVSLLTGRARGQGKDMLASFENVIGSIARDRIMGNAVANVLMGGPGPDYISGGAGDDFIDGGDGNDSLFGNEGNDFMLGGLGDERVFCGGDGDDTMDGGGGNDQVAGDAGNDELSGGDGNDRVCGGDGDDMVVGGDGRDSLEGGAGVDLIFGGLGFDFILTDLLDLAVDLGGVGGDGGKAFRV